MAVQTQYRFGQIVCPLVLYKASLVSSPFTLEGHNFCSRIFEITSALLALAAPHARRMGQTCRYVFVCVCVGLHIRNTMVSLHMKIWERFCLKLQSRISNVYLSCPWMAEVLHHLGIRSLYFVVNIHICQYIHNHIHINIITFNTSEVALNFIHQQHHSRLFLCLPRV